MDIDVIVLSGGPADGREYHVAKNCHQINLDSLEDNNEIVSHVYKRCGVWVKGKQRFRYAERILTTSLE